VYLNNLRDNKSHVAVIGYKFPMVSEIILGYLIHHETWNKRYNKFSASWKMQLTIYKLLSLALQSENPTTIMKMPTTLPVQFHQQYQTQYFIFLKRKVLVLRGDKGGKTTFYILIVKISH
jgi:hypothetical protein